MNKRKPLLPIQAFAASFTRLCACALLLLAFHTLADNTNQVLNAGIGGGTTQTSAVISDTGTNLADMSLDQLMNLQVPEVETASKFEQKATEAPANATVITSDEIKKYGWRTLGDLLASVPGFYISYDRDYQYVGTSGVNLGDANNRILLLVNGHRINDDINDSAAVDTSFILDLDLIDRVEIIRGPGSVLYGNNAFFAVINVITRQGKQVQGAEGAGTYGSFDEGSGRVTVGWQFTNSLQFLLSGTMYNNNGVENLYFPEPLYQPINHGVAHKMDADNYQSFFGSVSYWNFTLEGGYINRDKVNPTAQFDTTFNNPAFQTIDDRSYVTLKYSQNLPDDWSVLGDIYYDRSDILTMEPAGGLVFNEPETGQWVGTELQVNKKILDKHTITVGGEYRDDFEQSASLYEAENGALLASIRDHRQNYGIFGQGDFALLDDLRLNAGVRYDEYGNFSPDWSPRAALIYNPWQQSTFKFIYGTAFRDPNITELELSGQNYKSLRPEKISSLQLVYEQGINQYLRSSLSGYFNHMDNLIGLDSAGNDANFDAKTLGLEPAIEAKWKEVNARLSYSLQRTVNRQTDNALPDSPENMVKLNVSAPLYKNMIFAGLEVQYTSHSKTVVDSFPIISPGPDSPGYAIVNLTMFSENLFIKNLQLSASIYNLLNTKYYEPASNYHLEPYIQQDGITFRLKVTYSF
jgi:iron complex outermembrane receptor protein